MVDNLIRLGTSGEKAPLSCTSRSLVAGKKYDSKTRRPLRQRQSVCVRARLHVIESVCVRAFVALHSVSPRSERSDRSEYEKRAFDVAQYEILHSALSAPQVRDFFRPERHTTRRLSNLSDDKL